MPIGEYRATGVYKDTGNTEGRAVAISKVDADTATDLLKAYLKVKSGNTAIDPNPSSISLSAGLDPADYPLGGNGASQPATIVLISPSTGDTVDPTIGDVQVTYRVGVTNKILTTHADWVAFLAAWNAAHPDPGDYVFKDAHYN